jgi:hypothetical protein
MTILADTELSSVPAEILKWVTILGVAGIFILLAILGIISFFRKPEPTRIHDDPPIEVRKAPRRFNHDANELRFTGIEKRLDSNEEDIEKIKDLFREELPEMERRLDKANEDRVSEVHDRVNEILGEVRELRGEMNGGKK